MKQKRCAVLQIFSFHSSNIKQYRRMIIHRASESVYCTTKRH